MLPAIRLQARVAFRSFGPEAKEELIQEVVANAYVAFVRLVERGKTRLAYASPLASYAIRQVRVGRRVGNKANVNDVSSAMAKVSKGITVERLDRFDSEGGVWREVLVEDRHAGPAEVAASRIDVSTWFRSLAWKKRRVAKALARGETTSATARKHGLSAGRVSQLRQELAASWAKFQGELIPT
jgi:hypothetical protein